MPLEMPLIVKSRKRNSLTREEYKDGQLLISFDDEGV